MAPEHPTDRLKRELSRAVEKLKADLDRVELLTAALSAFHRPVPDYEPTFRHTHRMALSAHELRSDSEQMNFPAERMGRSKREMHASE
jgi:hypothetical protein